MRVLLFETTVYGHYLEYIHHLYEEMKNYPDDEMFLALPNDFENEKNLFKWSQSNNVHYISIPNAEMDKLKSSRLYWSVFYRVRLLRKYVREVHPDAIFLISVMSYMPFLPLLISRNNRVYSILYKLYMYRWGNMSFSQKAIQLLLFGSFKHFDVFKMLFVLNDKSSCSFLNRKYRTDKFTYIPDPYNKIDYKGKSLRSYYEIGKNETVFLHFGAMTGRKGTLEILDAILLMSETEKKGKVFIFAGTVSESFRTSFFDKVNSLKKYCRIIINEGFCSNEMLVDLCVTSDCILCPYKMTDLSSGVLGYAATYKKPVIGPSDGLIGKIIKRHHLGIGVPDITPETIKNALCSFQKKQINTSYDQLIKVDIFSGKIMSVILGNN